MALAWGFKVAPHWLLTGRMGLERFGSGIADSPIVEDPEQSSWSLRLTYDGEPFRVPDAVSAANLPRTQMLLGASRSDAPAPNGSDERRETRSLFHFDANVRLANVQQLAAGVIETDFANSGQTNPNIDLELRNLHLTYGLTLLRDAQKNLTLQAGVTFGELTIDGDVDDSTPLQSGTLKPRPTLGAVGMAHFANKLSLAAKAQWLMLGGDQFSGRQIFVAIGLVHRTFERAHFGLGYVFNRVALDLKSAETPGQVEPSFDGPSLFLSGSF